MVFCVWMVVVGWVFGDCGGCDVEYGLGVVCYVGDLGRCVVFGFGG